MIPFNKAYITGNEYRYMRNAVKKNQLSGDGCYTKKVSAFMEQRFKTPKALLATSCSAALDMAALLLDLKPGDEVILPSYTFVSTANAVLQRGAKPVFADIVESTLNIDPEDIARKVTKKTRAIFPVHYAGVSCDMDAVMKIAAASGLKVVEDAAQGVNARYRGRYLGTIGDIGCYSFHATKNYTCGEGGAILINHDPRLMARAEIIREKGTNRSRFLRGEVDKYTWVDVGSSFLPADILAAFLLAQFEKLDQITAKRKKIHELYYNGLQDLERQGILRLPVIPGECQSNYHMFYILLNSEKERNYLLHRLKAKGIQALFHYVPLHTSAMGSQLGYKAGALPKTEDLSGRLLRLPMYVGLSANKINYILSVLRDQLLDKKWSV